MPLTFLNIEKALIFRVTHITNVPWILDHGLHCRNSDVRDPTFREIGNLDVIEKRAERPVLVVPYGVLGDYVPFYFTPLSPMMLNITTGYGGVTYVPAEETAILVSSVRRLADLGVTYVLTDRHAYLSTAEYSSDLSGLERIDWTILRSKDFKRSEDDPGKIERYQAEALVHRHVGLEALSGIVCRNSRQQAYLDAELTRRGLSLKLVVKPAWYFR